MDKLITPATIAEIKNEARYLRGRDNLVHAEALNRACQARGYASWPAFITLAKATMVSTPAFDAEQTYRAERILARKLRQAENLTHIQDAHALLAVRRPGVAQNPMISSRVSVFMSDQDVWTLNDLFARLKGEVAKLCQETPGLRRGLAKDTVAQQMGFLRWSMLTALTNRIQEAEKAAACQAGPESVPVSTSTPSQSSKRRAKKAAVPQLLRAAP